MKKIIIYLGLITLVTSLGGIIVGAEEIADGQPIDTTTRAQVRVYDFSSKPPKSYKGMTLMVLVSNLRQLFVETKIY